MVSGGVCERCGSTNDVVSFNIGKEKHELCIDCRVKFLGRPSIGVTKKVSVTLSQDDWDWVDKQGSRSEAFRNLVRNARNHNNQS